MQTKLRHANGPRVLLVAALAIATLLTVPVVAQRGIGDGTLRIHYLDIGQGDAAVAITPSGKVVGFDAGPSFACDDVIDAYGDLGITEIDYLVISHYDADHIGCVPELLEEFPVTEMVLDRRGRHSTKTFKRYKRAIRGKRKKARPGRSFTIDKMTRFDANPVVLDIIATSGRSAAGKVNVQKDNQNDRGVVARLRTGEFEALFGGDISGTNESGHRDVESIVAPVVGDIEVYKVHHHGSRFSTSQAFLDVTKPKAAILSMGKKNSFGHPTREVLQRLRTDRKLRSYWTTRGNGAKPKRRLDRVCGDITVTVTPGESTFSVDCPGRRKTETFENTTDDPDDDDDDSGGGGGGGDDGDDGDDGGDDGDDGGDDGGGGGIPSMSLCVDLDDEEAHIRNNESTTVAMGDWKLHDAGPNFTYTFDSGFSLGPGQKVIVDSGPGAHGGGNRLFWTTRHIWNNDGDTGFLKTQAGDLVVQAKGTDGPC